MNARMRRICGALLIAVAIGYLANSLRGSGETLLQAVRDTDVCAWVLATAAFMPMFLAQAIYHADTLRLMDPAGGPVTRRADLAAYLQSQVVRYVPGKVWGLLYQVEASRTRHPATRVLGANLWQTVVTNLLSLGIAASLILPGAGLAPVWLAVAVALASLAVTEWLHRSTRPRNWHTRLLARVPLMDRLRGAAPPAPRAWRGTSLLLAEWMFFAIGLCLLLWDRLPVEHMGVAVGWYAASSTFALAAVAVPAGLAVREALFVGGQDLISGSSELLLVFAAQVRLSMLAAELLACALATLHWKVRGHG